MKLQNAYLCLDCQEVQDRAPRGRCDKCASEAVFPIARALAADPAAFLPKRLEPLEPRSVERLEPIGRGRRPLAERI